MISISSLFFVHLSQSDLCHCSFVFLLFAMLMVYVVYCLFVLFFFFFNWDSPHARLTSNYEAWSYKKRSTKRITGYRKSVSKEPTVKRCLLILNLKPLRSYVKGQHSIGREFQSLAVQGKKLLT